MAEATTSSSGSSSTPAPANPPVSAKKEGTETQQVILQSARDSELQPDALRGNDDLKKKLIDDGTLVDLEEDRANAIKGDKK